jgi:hypothetical protein
MDLTKHFHFRFLFFPVASPSRHLRLVADRRERRTTPDAPIVGTVPPAHATDSPALQPLHSAPFQFRRLHFHSTAFRRPQTGETVRKQIVHARKMAGAASTGRETSSGQQAIAHESLLAGKASAIRREATPVAEDKAIAPRGFARCKTPALTVRSAISAPPPFRRLHCSGQKQPNSLVKLQWSDTTAAGCGQVCRARPCCHRVAAHALRSAVVESEILAGAGATAPGNATRRNVAGFAAALA